MKAWAMQNAGMVRVLSPDSLAQEIREALENGIQKYRE